MRTVAALTLALALSGCQTLSAIKDNTNANTRAAAVPPPPPPPDPWAGVARLELEMHPLYSLLPRTTAVLSDGRELWTYEDGEACHRQFLIAGPVIEGRRLAGHCPPRCAAKPTSRPCTPAEAYGERQAAQTAESQERFRRVIQAIGEAERNRPRPVTTECQPNYLGGVRCVTQ